MKCPNCGTEVEKPKVDYRRSDPQNKYLHGYIVETLADHWGYSRSDTKAFIKLWYGVKNSSSLTTSQFEDWLRLLRQDVANPDSSINRHFGSEAIYLLEPNESFESVLVENGQQ